MLVPGPQNPRACSPQSLHQHRSTYTRYTRLTPAINVHMLLIACICTFWIDHRPMPAAPSLPSPACTCGRLRRAARALTQLYDDLMAPSGLRVTQFSLLRTLATHGTARMSALARALLLDRTALSRTLDPLVERGLVSITPGRDARTREVSLTRAGARAIRGA